MNPEELFPEIEMTNEKVDALFYRGLIWSTGRPFAWAKLGKEMAQKKVTQDEAKQLIILELRFNKEPRIDLLNRLANYVHRIDRNKVMSKIETLIQNKN